MLTPEERERAKAFKEKVDAALPEGDGFATEIDEQYGSIKVSIELHNQKMLHPRPFTSDEELAGYIHYVTHEMMTQMAAAVGMRLVHILGIREQDK